MKVHRRAMSGQLLLLILCNVLGALCLANTSLEDFTDGNRLWSGLVKDCTKPTAACVKSSVYDYLKDTLDYPSDVQFTSFLKFSKNSVNYTEVDPSSSEDDRSYTDETPLEEVTRSLADNSRKFLLTHDLELQLPETFFMGTTLKMSPRSVDDGTLVKMEVTRREADSSTTSIGEGRIFIKKIQQYIGERLLLAFLAVLVVIKLLAVKVLFVLPAIIGVAAAKKLILKVVLFLFPALHHLFKLCAYTPYGAKHHIHKHQISHIHQVAHPHKHHHEEGPPGYHYGDDHHYEEGPPGYAHGGYGEPDLNPAGPYFGEEVISHRRDPDEYNEVDGWGQGQLPKRPKPDTRKPLTSTEIENIVLKAEKGALIKSRLQKEKQRIHEENLRLQHQLNNALRIQEKLKQQSSFYSAKVPSFTKPRYPSSPLLPPPLPPTSNKYTPGSFAEPPYSSPTFANPPQSSIRAGNAVRIGPNTIGQNSFGQTPGTSDLVGQSSAAGYPVRDSIGPQSAVGGSFKVQHDVGGSNSVGFQNAIGLGNNVGHSNSGGSSGSKGGIGDGLPGETVQAVQNFVKQKAIQSQQHVFPVYNRNQPEQTQTQDNLPKPPPKTSSVQIVKSIEIAEPFKPEEPLPEELFDSFPKFGDHKPQSPPQPNRNQFDEDIYKAASVTFDPFYSPILEKIDDVLNDFDFIEEPCKERLICSMYKNPTKFSPHSNLLSAELSRDSSELKKPSSTNAAVVRFYKYVQAARDGQDKRDCIRLYPACVVNTEAK